VGVSLRGPLAPVPPVAMSLSLLLVALVAAAVVGACSADVQPSSEEPAEATDAPDLTSPPDLAEVLPDLSGTPPQELVVDDAMVGDGEAVRLGAVVTVEYVAVAWSSGEPFDASWDRGQPFSFQLGAGRVIEGWERGVEGMRVGGRRVLVVPPDLGYGEGGVPGTIEPGETLVFVIDLLDVDPPGPRER